MSGLRGLLLPALDVERADQPWPLIRAGMLVIVLLVAAIATWTWLAPLSGAVIATGVVKVDMNRKTVQHQEGGLVGEILVRDGSRVREGETLIVLKDVRVDAGNEAIRTQLHAELAKAARLSAEQSGAKTVTFPEELLERSASPRFAEFLRRETAVFRARREALANQLALIRVQVRDTQGEIKARNEQMAADDSAIRYQREELAQNQSLADQGFVTKNRLLALQRAGVEYEARRAEGAAELARAQAKISDLELRAETLRSSAQQEASNELRQTTAAVFELRERLRPAQDAEARQRIAAPITGVVVDLRVTAVNGIIAPREPILDIVPDNASLVIEARLRPEDISFVAIDALADVRLTSFRQRITPTVQGVVTYVSADRLVDAKTNTPYYAAHVHVGAEALQKAGDLKLQAGMPAEVFVQTTSRNALQYLLDPFLGFLQRSLREQ
ncbi:MAG TPA: HlyD family type I secretion periplasmic adaptor subunit [Burkholderiales bacterium]|nr:HlyD family type I secretion periplasmic adaptor subunit [Burkholderiales bacterium]